MAFQCTRLPWRRGLADSNSLLEEAGGLGGEEASFIWVERVTLSEEWEELLVEGPVVAGREGSDESSSGAQGAVTGGGKDSWEAEKRKAEESVGIESEEKPETEREGVEVLLVVERRGEEWKLELESRGGAEKLGTEREGVEEPLGAEEGSEAGTPLEAKAETQPEEEGAQPQEKLVGALEEEGTKPQTAAEGQVLLGDATPLLAETPAPEQHAECQPLLCGEGPSTNPSAHPVLTYAVAGQPEASAPTEDEEASGPKQKTCQRCAVMEQPVPLHPTSSSSLSYLSFLAPRRGSQTQTGHYMGAS
ncbi:hypothetical protein P7K49_016692 [Saguinus oedipus]|uniref:Uncharacterized protein n=1 Tax=Saguinus oedipus TaxID=9490 RepID=A0ABQ9VCU5_SAGOE|nr:hypothetical protein P7K49_016692 [Saguinus oedipus]